MEEKTQTKNIQHCIVYQQKSQKKPFKKKKTSNSKSLSSTSNMTKRLNLNHHTCIASAGRATSTAVLFRYLHSAAFAFRAV